MGDEALEPGELVIELWPRLRIAVGEVEGRDQDSVDGRFDVTRLAVLRITGQGGAGQYRIVIAREDCDAVPGTLALPDGTVAEGAKSLFRKGPVFGLEFLEADDVGLRSFEPGDEVAEAFRDVVDVECDDLQRLDLCSIF